MEANRGTRIVPKTERAHQGADTDGWKTRTLTRVYEGIRGVCEIDIQGLRQTDRDEGVLEIQYDPDEVRPANDVQATLLLEKLKQEMKNMINAIDRMKNDRPGLYVDMWGQLSPDSEDLVMRHPDYTAFSREIWLYTSSMLQRAPVWCIPIQYA